MELKKTHELFLDTWRLYKKYHGTNKNDNPAWKSLIDDGDGLIEKYGNAQYAREMVVATMKEIERQAMNS